MDQASSNKNDLQQGRCVEPLIWSENSERTAYGHRCVRGVSGPSRRVYFALFASPPCGTCLHLVGLCCPSTGSLDQLESTTSLLSDFL